MSNHICYNKNYQLKMVKYMKKSGFSLIELSIALIIIGILVASATVASTLINRAKLRAVINDYNTYKNAYNIFYATYEILPGDMSNDTLNKFFGAGVSNPAATSCNDKVKSEDNIIIGRIEGPRAFYQMSQAKTILGSYDGVSLAEAEVIGLTVGNSSYLDIAGYNYSSVSYADCDSWSYGQNQVYDLTTTENFLLFGAADTESLNILPNSVLNPENARDIDNKIDDGIPNVGKVLATHGGEVSFSVAENRCTSHANDIHLQAANKTISYMKENNVVSCRMMFMMDF
jgi:prepilin-type N-terminal cleavage/methylation domain-containing protein